MTILTVSLLSPELIRGRCTQFFKMEQLHPLVPFDIAADDEMDLVWILPPMALATSPPASPHMAPIMAPTAPVAMLARDYVTEQWVRQFVEGVPLVGVGDAAYNWYKTAFEHHFGRTARVGPLTKAILIDRLLSAMSSTGCQDPRANNMLNIVSPDLLHDEGHGAGVQLFLRLGRCFTVNDPLAFNCLLRELQRSHPSWPRTNTIVRGTKGITQIMEVFGIGPPAESRARNAAKYRGEANTDPDKVHPDGPRADGIETRETDGLYNRRYVNEEERSIKHAGRLFN